MSIQAAGNIDYKIADPKVIFPNAIVVLGDHAIMYDSTGVHLYYQ